MSKETISFSLARMAQQISTTDDFSLGLREFLDRFYENPSESRIRDEPVLTARRLQDEGYVDSYLAAVAEHLALQYGLAVPDWVDGAGRTLKNPRFAFASPEGRMFLLVESPTAFRKRHIFISADALTRV